MISGVSVSMVVFLVVDLFLPFVVVVAYTALSYRTQRRFYY